MKKKDERKIEKRSIKHAEDSAVDVVGRIRKIEKKTKRKDGENKDGENGGSESD